MYCGNNAQHEDLISGTLQLGNRYGCLRKGIGRGRSLPVDPNYLGPYSPIDQRKVYCGQEDDLPANYDLMGSLPQCLQKGIGIGKRQKALQGGSRNIFHRHKIIILTTIYLVLIGGSFSLLYFLRPSWVTKVDSQGLTHIDLGKFIPIYVAICLGLLLAFVGIWYQSE